MAVITFGNIFICIPHIWVILPLHFFTFALIRLWMLYLCLMWYVCVLHMIYYLVELHLGNIVMHISCLLFVMPFSPSLLTYINNSGLTYLCLNWLSHALNQISLLLVAQYLIYLFLLSIFCCFLLLGKILTWSLHQYKTHTQHQIYTILDQI